MTGALMNDKIMFVLFYCINSTKHCENEENIGIYIRFKCCLFVARWLHRVDYKSRISYCVPCLGERYSVPRVSRESYMSD